MLTRKKIGEGTHGWAVFQDDVMIAHGLTPLQSKSYVEDLSTGIARDRSIIKVDSYFMPYALEELKTREGSGFFDPLEVIQLQSLRRKIKAQGPGFIEMSKDEARMFSEAFPDSGAVMVGEGRIPGTVGQSYSIPREVREFMRERPPIHGSLGYRIDPALIDRQTWKEVARTETSEWPVEVRPLEMPTVVEELSGEATAWPVER